MKRRTLLLFMALSLVLTFNVGCQGKKEKRGGIARGRDARGGEAGAKTSDRLYGGIYMSSGQTQATFWDEVYKLTFAQLDGAADNEQLGFVSGSSSSTSTGIRFWGDVKSNGKGGIDQAASSLHISVYDDVSASGGDPIIINIADEIEGFVGISGTYANNSANIKFEDAYGMIRLKGSVGSSGYFEGTVYYYTYQTGSATERTLGHFKVKASGFFRN